jgi:hypothetical protein
MKTVILAGRRATRLQEATQTTGEKAKVVTAGSNQVNDQIHELAERWKTRTQPVFSV